MITAYWLIKGTTVTLVVLADKLVRFVKFVKFVELIDVPFEKPVKLVKLDELLNVELKVILKVEFDCIGIRYFSH